MKQLIQSIASGKATVADVPMPLVRPGHILAQVMASLVSAGTERSVVEFAEKNLVQKAMARPDLVRQLVVKAKREGWISTLETARHRLDTDMALGYSNAGIVIQVGEGVRDFSVGDRVACAGGGFATHSEIVRVPKNLVALIPSGSEYREVSFEEAAFATVAAIGLQAIRLAELLLGDIVAVIGLGLVGQMIVQLARANGCTVLGLDPSPDRCQLAERMGCATAVQTEEEMRTIANFRSDGRGVDAILIAAATDSNDPVTIAAEIARDRARVIAVGAVGLSLPRKQYYMKELDFRVSRSYGPGRYDPDYEEKGRDYPVGYVRWTEGRNLAAVLQLLAAGRLNFVPLITHRIPIQQADKAYELISGKTNQPFLGVVITYPSQVSLSKRIENTAPVPTARADKSEVCVGVIGAGNFAAATLLPAMKATKQIQFGGICTAGGSSARTLGLRYGFRFFASDESELLRDERINTIVVCTRHSTHAPLVTSALRAGKHVFCEKPLAMSTEELVSILRALDDRTPHQLLMVGYNRRFAPLSKRLKAFVSDAQEPFVFHYRINAGFIPRAHWTQDPEVGGGRILGEVCHFIDLLCFLCSQPVVSVSGALMPNAGRYSDDNLAATLRFDDGSIGTITYTANGDRSFSKERVELFVQGSVAVLDDFRELRTVKNGKQRVYRSNLRVDKGHRGEWAAFANAIRCGGPTPISLNELVNSSLATLALLRASATGESIEIQTEQFINDARAAIVTTGEAN